MEAPSCRRRRNPVLGVRYSVVGTRDSGFGTRYSVDLGVSDFHHSVGYIQTRHECTAAREFETDVAGAARQVEGAAAGERSCHCDEPPLPPRVEAEGEQDGDEVV